MKTVAPLCALFALCAESFAADGLPGRGGIPAVAPYGLCVHRMHYAVDRERAMPVIAANGVGAIRVDCNWEWIEPEKGERDFSSFDALFSDAERHGLDVLPILHHGAAWTKPYAEHYDDWRAFVRAFAERYGSRLRAIEIWNEVNLGHVGVGSPELYAKFLKGAYDEIKAVAPHVLVTTSGFAGPAPNWVKAIYRTVGADSFDVVNFHHYSFPWEIEDFTLESDFRKLREVMESHGDGDKPVWLTECGYPTHQPSLAMHNVFKTQLPVFDPDKTVWRVRMVAMGDETDNQLEGYSRLMKDELPEGADFGFVLAGNLAEALADGGFDVLVLPFHEKMPDAGIDEMLEFVRRGGIVAQFGEAAMSYAVPRGEDGVWRFTGGRPNGVGVRRRFGFDVAVGFGNPGVPVQTKVEGVDSSYKFSAEDVTVGMWSLGSVRSSRWMVPVESADLPGLEFTPLLGCTDASGKTWTAAARLRLPGEKAGGLIIGCMDENDQNLMTSTLDRQARTVARQYLFSQGIGCEEVFWYVYKTWEGDTEARRLNREPWFGLVRPSTEEPKPAMVALKTLTAMRPAGSVVRDGAWQDKEEGVYFPQWTAPDGIECGALWAKAHRVGEPRREPRVFEFSSDGIEFLDYLGTPSRDVKPLGDGKYEIALSDGVVFFRGGLLKN